MQFIETRIPGVIIVEPKRIVDDRGFFSEVFRTDRFEEATHGIKFVQENFSLSHPAGVLRGLHFQTPPFAQGKLVRVLSGAIYDVALDLRVGSPTYGEHIGVELSKDNWRQLYIPEGFAHGFITLQPDTEVLYKVTNFYSAANDAGLLWNDPDLKIEWPQVAVPLLSLKDKGLPRLRELTSPFSA